MLQPLVLVTLALVLLKMALVLVTMSLVLLRLVLVLLTMMALALEMADSPPRRSHQGELPMSNLVRCSQTSRL